jgi:DNA-binding transcriptional LysR family regulator
MFEKLLSRSGLSLDRLRSFLAFAQAGSISKAAPDDVNQQSQISRQISELESFFSTELTMRRGKTLTLTAAGRRLAMLIQQQLQDLDDFWLDQTKQKKTFTLGAGASILDWLVIPALGPIGKALGHATLRLDTLRSRPLIEGVKEGRIDFAVVRDDAIPAGLPRLPLICPSFYLCVPRCLLKHGTQASALHDPKLWRTLPFTAGKDGGQLDFTLRQAMCDAGVDFQPIIECNSMLQARQLIERGVCAGVLPSVGIQGLSAKDILVSEFAPMKNYGRKLVLHWNERQMRRRNVQKAVIEQVATALR